MINKKSDFLDYVSQLYANQNEQNLIKFQTYMPGELIFKQGAAVKEVYIIQKGLCKISIEEENGKAYILEFLGKGEILGELELIRDSLCLCNVQALEKVEVFVLSKSFFLELLATDLKLNHLLIKSFADRISKTSKKASFQQLYTLEEALKKFKILQAEHDLKISKNDLAEYLGISVRSLNRSLKNLEDEN